MTANGKNMDPNASKSVQIERKIESQEQVKG